MRPCKVCRTPVAVNALVCPHCGAGEPRPGFLARLWNATCYGMVFWVGGVLSAGGLVIVGVPLCLWSGWMAIRSLFE